MKRRSEQFPEDNDERRIEVREQDHQPTTSRGPAEMTVIGQGAKLEGNLISAASLRIEGSVKGTVTADGDVIVAPEADVSADIRATNVTIAGSYKGNITAGGTLELSTTAKVEGNISCRSLIVNQGAILSGQSMMGADTTVGELDLSDEALAEED